MNISEATDTVNLLRVLQGLRRMDGEPYHPDAVVAACEALAVRAGKALNVTIPVSRAAVVQTLDHLAELDGEGVPA